MEPDDLLDEARYRPTPEDQLPPADLTELMEQAAQNPVYFLEFCRRLLVEPLLVLVAELPQDWEPGSQVRQGLPLLHLAGGELPVFTSSDALFAESGLDPETTKSVSVIGRELLSAVRDQKVVLNPFNEINLLFEPAFIDQILSGQLSPPDMQGHELTEEEQANDELYVAQIPDEYAAVAEQLKQQIRLLLGQRPRARAAYLIWERHSGKEPESCFLLLLIMEGDSQRISQEIGFIARDLLKPTKRNLKILAHTDPAAFDAYTEGLQVAPFYEG